MHSLNWLKRSIAGWLILGCLLLPTAVPAQVAGIAPDIPEAENRNVIVQLFNWRFNDIHEMTAAADAHGIKIIVDTVLNHTIDLKEAPPELVKVVGNKVVADKFPQF